MSVAELGSCDFDAVGDPVVVTALAEAAPQLRPPIVTNLGSPVALAALEEAALIDHEPLLFLMARVLEQLVDPRPLLRVLRRHLKRNVDSRLLIATVDRSQTGTAREPDTVRAWSRAESAAFFASSGFELMLHESTCDGRGPIVISELRCSSEYHERWLSEHDLPTASDWLVLLSSDAQHPYSDNIERYVAELTKSEHSPIVLSVGTLRTSSIGRAYLRAEDLISWSHPTLAPDGILEAVLHIVFIYDGLACIEFQDYGGLFFRIPQAKRSALLPPNVLCRVVCHGNSFYFERMTKRFQRAEANLMHLWEKIAVELADEVIFPTDYSYRLYYRELGLRPLGSPLVRQLPFHSQRHAGTMADPQPTDTIVFLGAQMSDNGWPEFSQAVATLSGSAVVRLDPNDADLPRLLANLSSRSIVVVAKALCGYPYPLMQAIEAGCAVLMFGAGGANELIPPGFRDHALVPANGADLLHVLRRLLALSPSIRAEHARALRDEMRERHEAALAAWHESPAPASRTRSGTAAAQMESPVTVVVPVYNRPFDEIEELIIGLNSQTLLPREVIFVDDASDLDFATLHAGQIQSLLRVRARFIRHGRNKGLSGARNTGLRACVTEFVAMHDSDNIAANDFLYRGCAALAASPAVDAVTFEMMAFPDGDDWTADDQKREYHRPIGDGVVHSLANTNWFGDAMAVYRVASARECGGWDDCDRAMWEDLAFFIKLAVSGRRIMNAPRREVFYRIRAHSMQRAGSKYDARQRLVRVLSALSPFEALCVERLALTHATPKLRSSRELLLDAVRQYLGGKPRLLRTLRLARSVVRKAWNGLSHGRKMR